MAKEYIERESLKAKKVYSIERHEYVVPVAEIDWQPPADVAEVVRCKDCKYYGANSCFNRQWDLESSTEIPLVRDIDFCSYGERKEK